jgi:toxin ParE1/3/4
MEEKPRKVVLSEVVKKDLSDIYDYGLVTFGESFSESFLQNIYKNIFELPLSFLLHPECRHLATKKQTYRNIILGRYLIIYRIKNTKIEVLRALHGSRKTKTIKAIKKIKTK